MTVLKIRYANASHKHISYVRYKFQEFVNKIESRFMCALARQIQHSIHVRQFDDQDVYSSSHHLSDQSFRTDPKKKYHLYI